MDKRNSKTNMLNRITELEDTLNNVYTAGINGIAYVGAANYTHREIEAKGWVNEAMYA